MIFVVEVWAAVATSGEKADWILGFRNFDQICKTRYKITGAWFRPKIILEEIQLRLRLLFIYQYTMLPDISLTFSEKITSKDVLRYIMYIVTLFLQDVSDEDIEKEVQSRRKEPPKLIVFTNHHTLKTSFVVADGVTIKSKKCPVCVFKKHILVTWPRVTQLTCKLSIIEMCIRLFYGLMTARTWPGRV